MSTTTSSSVSFTPSNETTDESIEAEKSQILLIFIVIIIILIILAIMLILIWLCFKTSFKRFFDTESNYKLISTKDWIKRSFQSIDLTNEIDFDIIFDKVMINAFIELLVVNNSAREEYPETLVLIRYQINEVKAKVFKLTLIGSVFLAIYKLPTEVDIPLKSINENKQYFKKLLDELIYDQTIDYSTEELKRKLTLIAFEVKQKIEDYLKDREFRPLDETDEQLIETQIIDIHNSDNELRKDVEKRILEFIKLKMASQKKATLIRFPTGLSVIQKELKTISNQFVTLFYDNMNDFLKDYRKIFNDLWNQRTV